MAAPRGARIGLLVLAAIAGCSSTVTPPPSPAAAENLRKIALAYNNAVGKNKKPPQNLEQLKPFLKDMGNPEEILRSPGDGQPYVIIWGVTSFSQLNPSVPMGDPVVIAYERNGVDGRRFVATTMGNVVEMSDEEFAKANFPRGHKPG